MTAAERGTALHLAMQHLNYAACADESGLRSELERLGRQKFLTPQQLEAVDPERLRRFFASPLGQRVLQAPQVVREFKFSVLDDGANYDPALEGEEICCRALRTAASSSWTAWSFLISRVTACAPVRSASARNTIAVSLMLQPRAVAYF